MGLDFCRSLRKILLILLTVYLFPIVGRFFNCLEETHLGSEGYRIP